MKKEKKEKKESFVSDHAFVWIWVCIVLRAPSSNVKHDELTGCGASYVPERSAETAGTDTGATNKSPKY